MPWLIEVKDRKGIFDAVGEGIKKDILDLGINTVKKVSFIQVYIIDGDISGEEARKICEELFVDRISQVFSARKREPGRPAAKNRNSRHGDTFVVEVAYNPGVMDPVEESALKGICDLGIKGVRSVKTARKYLIRGRLSAGELKTVSEKLLYNKLIQHIVKAPFTDSAGTCGAAEYKFNLLTVDLINASDKRLRDISRKGQLFLNLDEMRKVRDYFRGLGRNPTDCELETIAQTWSEHCGHKTFRGRIEYTEVTRSSFGKLRTLRRRTLSEVEVPGRQVTRKIDNLLKSTIMKATKQLNKPWCVSVFKDNSGVIRFDDKYNVCFKVETHNHPSALEPFGGANTGIGGVIRDALGTGLAAKPILNTDVFCFGRPDYPFSRLLKGTLHPKRVMKGVVAGVRDYGNKMGIPTVNGAILFDDKFVGNPLVYCGTAGILPKDKSFKKSRKGDLVVLVGGRTGRDGIHGATFSSGELTEESERISSGAVQIGNPIQEKRMADTILQARDEGLYDAITDCGGGGLSSAVGEMGSELGVEVHLEQVPLKYMGLSYAEIWISESQERMILSVPEANFRRLKQIFDRENVEATVIGRFTGSGRLNLYYRGNPVCDLDMLFLHEGLPKIEKKAVFALKKHAEPRIKPAADLTAHLMKLLSHYNICSKEWVIRQYDHEVQGGSVLKPLAGLLNDGPSDASVVKPLLWSDRGVIVSCGINFRFGMIDPYWMASSCIDEALRQVIAVGGSLKEVALLDNFCWGNPDKPDRLGGLVRAAFGCLDTALGFGVPFISGKDSLYNEYAVGNKSLPIPGTLLISAIAVMEDVNKAVSMPVKQPDNLIYVAGNTYSEMGGSHYYDVLGFVGNDVPKVNPVQAKRVFEALSRASSGGLIRAMHDCSEGGIAVACAEMALAGGYGMEIFLSEVPCRQEGPQRSGSLRDDVVLFSESNSRFIVEVERKDKERFEQALSGVPFGLAGCVCGGRMFRVFGLDGKLCVKANIDELKAAWKKPLDW